jgi:hypothetical protein
VDAGLALVEVDEALELGEVEALSVGDGDDLLDPADADPGQADLGCRLPGLDVGSGGWDDLAGLEHRFLPASERG